ncbi:hypothetical protein [Actinomycetospora cinnamomea]|uniref:Uncharacterized protein n=1 Tax=Actinomycetospora cinnamomea TaxID=663609 RepID=A0A2U1EDB7_9PSEU|nr:hypothetical protein [Actinomycetospora cinnamomea]PVY97954.1 hypothetical protein C8D89_1229 [Actinomycetospora cinnamomea]
MNTKIEDGSRWLAGVLGLLLLVCGGGATFIPGTNSVGLGFMLAAGAVLTILAVTGVLPQKFNISKDSIDIAYQQGAEEGSKDTKDAAKDAVKKAAAANSDLTAQLAKASDPQTIEQLLASHLTHAVETGVPEPVETARTLAGRRLL